MNRPLPSSPALLVNGIHCRLGGRHILRGLDAQPIRVGTVAAIVGPNGAGKSTLLRCIAGFVPCEAERMEVHGKDLRRLKPSERSACLRYLPQAAPGPLNLSVQECLDVALHAQPGRLDRTEANRRVAEVVAELGIAPLLEREVDELSGGQKQLVWLAQALLHPPRALLLDEPLAALDPNHQHHVMRLLRRLAHSKRLAVLIVLHDLNMAARYADDVLVLSEGRILSQGAVAHALTPETLAQAFRVRARVETCSLGAPLILIDDLIDL